MKKIIFTSIFLILVPIFFVILGKIMINFGFKHLVLNYELEFYKKIMAVLYFIGLGAFFLCSNLSEFLEKKLFSNKRNQEELQKKYFIYTLIMLSFLDITSLCGFIGFLICGNFSWLVTFSLVNLLSVFSYFPTTKRFHKKISTITI